MDKSTVTDRIKISIPSQVSLGDSEFTKLSRLIHSLSGIKLSDSKKDLVENRLQKRLKSLQLTEFSDYLKIINDPGSQERKLMIDEVSTNKTYFFREPDHFNFMTREILPKYQELRKDQLNIWSNACSSGEEVYTISIILEEYNKINNPGFEYQILGTDISTRMIREAERGIYPEALVGDMSKDILKEYFLQSVNRKLKLVKIDPKLRRNTRFDYLNLISDSYALSKFDIIFCRNVLIYFDRQTQESVITKICSSLNKGGYLIISHSESILGFDVPLKKVGPSIYQKI